MIKNFDVSGLPAGKSNGFVPVSVEFEATLETYYIYIRLWPLTGVLAMDEFTCYPVGYTPADKAES